jgi:hypothetical protein
MPRKQRMCILCRKNPAAVPDRNKHSSRKEVCRQCHADRLRGDLARILKAHERRNENPDD